MEELYRVFSRGVRFYLCRQLGPQDLDDTIHDVYVIITQSIRNGELRDPERLMGYVRTIIRRQVAGHIDHVVEQRRRQGSLEFERDMSDHQLDPERRIIQRQRQELALRILQSLHQREREVLVRFYLEEQAPGEICREMDLTQTQFRLIKSRAKARFGELGRASFARRARYAANPPHHGAASGAAIARRGMTRAAPDPSHDRERMG